MRCSKCAAVLSAALLALNGFLLQPVNAALTDGLVAYYPLDGNGNDLAQGNNATTNGTGVDYQAGRVGQALNLDRTEGNQWLSVTGTDLFGNTGLAQDDTSATAYSWQAWINPDTASIAGSPGDGYIVAGTLSSIDNHGFVVSARIDGSGQLDAFVEKPSTTGFTFESNQNHPLPTSVDGWYHVFVTWDSQVPVGPGELKVYIDNVLIATEIDDALANSAAIATDGLNIGADQLTGPGDDLPGRFYDGLLDEIAIWNRVVTDAERTALYNNGSGIAIVPEPASFAMLLMGLGLITIARKKQR